MRRRSKRGRWRATAVVLALAAGAWLAGLVGFAEEIPRQDAVEDTRITDAIVVLTGGRGRIERGVELLNQGKARLLLISGVADAVSARDLLTDDEVSGEFLACCVTLGRDARDTRGNAVEAAAWARTHNVESLRLVTADFHMPRSLFEFRRLLPEAEIVPDPVSSENVRLARWWLWPGTASLLASEHAKLLAARLRGLTTDMLAML